MDSFTARDIAAFNAGIRAAREAALIVAVTLETREGATCVRDRAAIQALRGFADGLDALVLGREAGPMQRVFATIQADGSGSGTIECPICKGRLAWARDSSNGHLSGQCETDDCLQWMQ
ncbi:hypothetical protein [Methylobacterium sp. J-077]|uniref:hypothetical protein n=1 Tax=Methylobacterium sp. J-077 TaxID=2836656 RepID=UPI001FB97F2E|nr:hypothetical protein [Methylobacterium sp. J-077]MCJ2121042.1 hypothetical protein [Methylobacterium sp. J-077]